MLKAMLDNDFLKIGNSWQNEMEDDRAERLRKATERLRSPVMFSKDSAVRRTHLQSFSQYVESRPGEELLR